MRACPFAWAHRPSSGAGTPTINATCAALRFFFKITLDRPDLAKHLTFVHEPRKIQVVLSPEEMARFLEAAPGVKYKAALSVAYGAGLRLSEVVSLKVSDIYSQRMMLRVEQGKGRKDRHAMLSPVLLQLLRDWYRLARPQGWLFPGQNPVTPLSTRQLTRACHAAAGRPAQARLPPASAAPRGAKARARSGASARPRRAIRTWAARVAHRRGQAAAHPSVAVAFCRDFREGLSVRTGKGRPKLLPVSDDRVGLYQPRHASQQPGIAHPRRRAMPAIVRSARNTMARVWCPGRLRPDPCVQQYRTTEIPP
jgi:hypothetical protein